jgi:hypothetical protein
MLREVALGQARERLQVHEVRISAGVQCGQNRQPRWLVDEAIEVRDLFERRVHANPSVGGCSVCVSSR